MSSNFICPCCQLNITYLGEYLTHPCQSNCDPYNCSRMDIFDIPAPKRARLSQVITPHCDEICSTSSNCNRGVRCLFNRRNNIQQSDLNHFFPEPPHRINQAEPVPIEIIDLTSDDEELPLDLTVPRHLIPPPASQPLDLRQQRDSVTRYAPTFITLSDSDSSGEDLVIDFDSVSSGEESTNDSSSSSDDSLDDFNSSSEESPNDFDSTNETCQRSTDHLEAESSSVNDIVSNSNQELCNQNSADPIGPQVKKNSKKGCFKCTKCGKVYVFQTNMEKHFLTCGLKMCTANPANVPVSYNGFTLMEKAFANYYLVYRCVNNDQKDLASLFAEIEIPLFCLLKLIINEFKTMKYYFTIHLTFHEEITGRYQEVRFSSSMHIGLMADIRESSLSEVKEEIEERIDQYTQRGSGWSLSKINHIDLLVGRFIPHAGGCKQHKLPDRLKNKKCLISPATEKDCFMYSVLIGLHKANHHRERINNYQSFISNYDFSMVRGIVPVTNIKKFEKKNQVSVNLYTYDFGTEKVVPMKVADIEKEKHVNIFLHDQHYYYISDMARLANNVKTRSRVICNRCMSSFRSQAQVALHKLICVYYPPQRTDMPHPSKAVCKRYNYRKEVKFPFCIYADFETLSVSRNIGEHVLKDLVPCSYGYVVVDWEDKIIHSDFYLGEQVGQKFLQSLKALEPFLEQNLSSRKIKKHNLTQSQEQNFQNAINCHICEKELRDDRVRDHDHLTGLYRGAAHQKCNLEYRVPQKYPVVFHNLKNFDGHIIINALDINFCEEPKIIPHNMEKYIGFFLGKFKFTDSFAFLTSSLDNLSSNVPTERKNHYLQQVFGTIDTSLLLKKSTLPYEYLTSLEVFKESILPEKTAFYSSLTDSNISDEMYKHLQRVWQNFNCQTLKDLHDIYLKVDVLLLAAVFQNFREMSISNFSLDPLHQFSAPGLTWSALLKTTRIELALFTSVDMFQMIENQIRGGLTMLNRKHVKANNPLSPDYDPDNPTTYLLYLDVNNLYGYSMSQKLPVSGFKWSHASIQQILDTPDDGDIGYFLEVDLEYPENLHDYHDDFPLAPEKREMNREMYSSYQQELVNDLKERGIKTGKSTKLVTTFYKKERYVVHYRTLKFYVSKGLKVSKVHRVIEFKQSSWLAEYVSFCTTKRQGATSDFERDFWKLLVNSIYGKTIEDKRKHRTIFIALKDTSAQRHLRKNNCEKFMILDENKVIFWMKKLLVKLDKPIAVGFAVLELAKLKMYQIHYDSFKARYQNDISLIYTDTDSLVYEIKTQDIVNDLRSFSSIMDFSNYPKNHPLYSDANNKKIGYLKDELGGQQLIEFVGIRPKLYALRTEDDVKKRAKGVPRAVLKNKITFESYLDCLYKHSVTKDNSTTLQSDRHNIQMVSRSKIMLSPLDDKRYWIDRNSSLAYGHCEINNF